MVELENNLRFTANFKYTIKPNITKDPAADFAKVDALFRKLDAEGSPPKYHFDSHCDETMIGFVHNMSMPSSFEEHPVTCFYGTTDKSQLYEDQVAPAASLNQVQVDGVEIDVSLVQTNKESTPAPKKQGGKSRSDKSFNTAGNLFLKHKPSDEMDLLISHINDNQHIYTWQANTCML